MKQTFTREEVQKILIGLCIFSGSNNNQGLKPIHGESFGEKADHILLCADGFDEVHGSGIVTMVGKLRNALP